MEIETLKKSHLKRNIVIAVVLVAIISTIILTFTKAKYKTTESIPLVNGTINYTPYDLKMVAMYQEENGDYKSIDTVPTSGYTLNEEKSYCEVNDAKDDNISMEYKDGKVYIGVSKKGTKCYLYFDIQNQYLVKEYLLSKYQTILARNDFNVALTENTTGIIYQGEDNDGQTYYFAGNPTDNWVKFAGFYWRIIRINGDGTLRLIYNGINADATGDNTSIKLGSFNNDRTNNMYVGYKYTNNEIHGLNYESTILIALNEWYQTNLQSYSAYIDINAGFCGDREPSTNNTISNGSGGTGTTNTYYASYIRLVANKNPTYKCKSNDLYTTSKSNKGNKSLSNPIGLISADEVAYAGGSSSISNNNYFLFSKGSYWTMSPYFFYNNGAYVFYVDWYTGKLAYFSVSSSAVGIRPVINLASDVTIKSGNGTSKTPYEIS